MFVVWEINRNHWYPSAVTTSQIISFFFPSLEREREREREREGWKVSLSTWWPAWAVISYIFYILTPTLYSLPCSHHQQITWVKGWRFIFLLNKVTRNMKYVLMLMNRPIFQLLIHPYCLEWSGVECIKNLSSLTWRCGGDLENILNQVNQV